MFDIGWTELLVIGVVALIVLGPKDLLVMFRTLGRFTGKARGMAREFQRAMESAADEAGVKDVARDLREATSSKNLGLDAVKDAATRFEKWEPGKPAAKAAPKGPATQALAEKTEAKRAALAEKAAAPRAQPDPDAPAPPTEKGDA